MLKSLWNPGYGLTAYCENIKNMYYGLWTMDYGLWTTDYRLGIKSKLSIKHGLGIKIWTADYL